MKTLDPNEDSVVISKDDVRELELFVDCLRSDLLWVDSEGPYILIQERDRDRWLSILERVKNQLK